MSADNHREDPTGRRLEWSAASADLELESNQLSALLDSVPGCIALILEKDTHEIVASNRLARELGAVPGETCFTTCSSRDDLCPFCLASELWATGELQHLEVEYRGKWYERVWAPLSHDSYVHYIFDITERKVAEEALKESEAGHRLLADNASDVIWTMDLKRNFTYVSPSVERLRGFTVAEVMRQSMDEALTPASAARAKVAFEQAVEAIRAGRPCPEFRGELEQPCKDGSTVWTDLTVSGIYDSADVLAGFLGVTRDITYRKRAEEELAKSESHFRSVIEYAADAIYVIGRDEGRILACNEQACRDTGYPREELLGMFASDIEVSLPGEEVDAVHLSLTPGAALTLEGVHRRKDGSTFPVEIRFALMEEAEPQLVLSVTRDITERRRAEEALRQSEEQLRQSQKMEAVGQLAGGIAHDFNNLLTAIIGYSDLILSDEKTRGLPLHDDVGEIRHAAERAAALTRQILAFSRRQALSPALVSLNVTILEMEQLLRRTLGEDIELVTMLHPALGVTEVDVHQFEQVLMNLAVNARDAMPLGGRLTVATANVELGEEDCRASTYPNPGSYVTLSVSDTGLGMDDETLSHIFEPFFTTKAIGEGTGLGLSTVYGIVRQSGGGIDAESEPGRGSTFKIYLPRTKEAESADKASILVPSVWEGQETILVVEDEESLRNLVTRILRGLGYTVLSAAAAGEALELLANHDGSVDLLVTDVVLPGGVQGNDLVRLLTSSRPDLLVLYMSGYPRDSIVHGGRLDEGVNYLQKPFTPKDFGDKIREVLGPVQPSIRGGRSAARSESGGGV